MSIDRTIVTGEHLQDTADVMRSSRTMLATCRAALASYAARSCRGEKGSKQSRESTAEHWRRASTEPRLFRCSALAAASRVTEVEAIAHLVRPMRAHSTESNTMAITAPFLIRYHNRLAVHTRSCRLR